MICLFFELCKCTKRDPKNKQELHINLEDTDRNNSEQSRKVQISKSRGCFQKPSKTCAKEACKITGKIIVCMVIFITFSATFGFGFMTLSHVLGFIDLTFTYAGPLNLSPNVITSYYGPGLDAKPDEAMFIYLHYKLPDWHYISLNDSGRSKSASFRYVINRLYFGQFDELSHLKDGTLTKVIPCFTAMHFLQNRDAPMDHVNCKIIFTLRYFPVNFNWQPFHNLIHDYHKFITIQYGIHLNNKTTCPGWFNKTSYSSFFSDQVQEDILKYTCNSACGQDKNICRNVSWNIHHNQRMDSLNESVELSHLSFAVHRIKTPDTCDFHLNFVHSTYFCEKSWNEIEPVKVPEDIENSYPQFITVPITTTWDESRNLRIFNNRCDQLWQNETVLELDPGNYSRMN